VALSRPPVWFRTRSAKSCSSVRKAGLKGTLAEPVSPHGLRAGFVTTAYGNGVPDEEIMGHTRHRSLTTMRSYVRRAKLSRNSPAGKLGL
jgi:integrase